MRSPGCHPRPCPSPVPLTTCLSCIGTPLPGDTVGAMCPNSRLFGPGASSAWPWMPEPSGRVGLRHGMGMRPRLNRYLSALPLDTVTMETCGKPTESLARRANECLPLPARSGHATLCWCLSAEATGAAGKSVMTLSPRGTQTPRCLSVGPAVWQHPQLWSRCACWL